MTTRMSPAAFEQNNGVVVVDPTTGELRRAGTFTQNEWTTLTKANPDLATAIIANRQAEVDRQRALEAKRAGFTLAGGTVAGAGLLAAIPQSRMDNWVVDGLTRYENTLVPEDSIIYESNDAAVYAPKAGVVEFVTTEGLPYETAVNESLRARDDFRRYVKQPEGQKLYTAIADDLDPVVRDQKQRIYQKVGFSEPDRTGVMRLDARKGADQFGGVYRTGDRVADIIRRNGIASSKTFRYGGAALAALTLGGLAHGAWNLINPLERGE